STVNDLTGTEVTQTNVDLGAGDGAADTTTVNGTAGADNVKVGGGGGGSLNVTGLASPVTIAHGDPATDVLNVNALAGADTVDASNAAPGSAALATAGGPGADTLTGSPGDDAFVWNPGDESDVLDGKAGTDTLRFNGSNAAETVVLSANGPRLQLFRDVAAVTQDASGVEHVDFNAIGGADALVVNDLTGTDVTQANVDLGA